MTEEQENEGGDNVAGDKNVTEQPATGSDAPPQNPGDGEQPADAPADPPAEGDDASGDE